MPDDVTVEDSDARTAAIQEKKPHLDQSWSGDASAINTDPDFGQAGLQAKADAIEALGYVPVNDTSPLDDPAATVADLQKQEKAASKAKAKAAAASEDDGA